MALVGILYGALVAWVQTDMKKLVAYSSIAHLGFVMLGLLAVDAIAWQGALMQMVNHGLSTGALFLLVGMIYERRHSKAFADLGGLAKPMPVFAFFLVWSALASVGPAGAQRLRRRVPDPRRLLPHPPLVGGGGGLRRGAGGDLPAQDAAPDDLGPDHPRGEPAPAPTSTGGRSPPSPRWRC